MEEDNQRRSPLLFLTASHRIIVITLLQYMFAMLGSPMCIALMILNNQEHEILHCY